MSTFLWGTDYDTTVDNERAIRALSDRDACCGVQSLLPGTLPRLLLVTDLQDGSQSVCDVIEWLSANRAAFSLSEWLDLKADMLTAYAFPATANPPVIGGGAAPTFRVELCTTRHFSDAMLPGSTPRHAAQIAMERAA